MTPEAVAAGRIHRPCWVRIKYLPSAGGAAPSRRCQDHGCLQVFRGEQPCPNSWAMSEEDRQGVCVYVQKLVPGGTLGVRHRIPLFY